MQAHCLSVSILSLCHTPFGKKSSTNATTWPSTHSSADRLKTSTPSPSCKAPGQRLCLRTIVLYLSRRSGRICRCARPPHRAARGTPSRTPFPSRRPVPNRLEPQGREQKGALSSRGVFLLGACSCFRFALFHEPLVLLLLQGNNVVLAVQ